MLQREVLSRFNIAYKRVVSTVLEVSTGVSGLKLEVSAGVTEAHN